MPTIIRKLKKKDGKLEWRRLRETYEYIFLHGSCYAFAIALYEELGWPIVGLFVRKGGMEIIDHTGVQDLDGRIFDVRGFVSEEEFGSLYTYPPYDIRKVAVEDLSVTAPVGEYSIRRARQIAEILYPELPWRETRASRVQVFADELEALCRKHNKWIRSPIAAHAPLLQEGDGSETGYELLPTLDGLGYTINCYLR